jgi:methylenetetrahydrofolate reductase (NADPH)
VIQPETGGRLARLLEAGTFAVTGEVVPPRSADADPVTDQVRELVGYVDAVNVTDNPVASPHMSPLAGVHFASKAGVEPTVQLVARDRNSLALTGDLLGAWALGARNVLVLAGDPLSAGDHPDAKAVFDLGPNELVSLARQMRDEGTTLAGAEIVERPRFLIGVADAPLSDPYDPSKLEAKIDAGADYVVTQIAFDVEALAAWVEMMRTRGLFERAKVMIGMTPLRSAKQARFMDERLFGVSVPRSMIEALDDAGERAQEEGLAFTVEIARALVRIDGVAGLHIMGMGHEDLVRGVIEEAGLYPRPSF